MNSVSVNNDEHIMAELSDSEEWTDINKEVLYHSADSEFDAKSYEEGSLGGR